MRALVLLSAALLVCLPCASASPIPTITITLDQSSASVNATNFSQPVIFTGSVSVNKSDFLSASVSLTSSVLEGWNSVVSPETMTFTTTTPQSFMCTVEVPAGTAGGTEAQLTVEGTVVSGILQAVSTAQATILVVGTLPPPVNQTGNTTNTTDPTNGGSQNTTIPGFVSNTVAPGFLGFSNDQWMVIGVIAVVVLIGAAVGVRSLRRRRSVYDVDEGADD